MWSPYIAQTVLFFSFILPPSRQLTEFRTIQTSVPLPHTLTGGQPLILPNSYYWRRVNLTDQDMSYLASTNSWLGSVGLYKGDISQLLIIDSFNSPKWWQWYKHPRLDYISKDIAISKPALAKANKLRLPAKVWIKMDSKFERQKRLERKTMRGLLNKTSGRWFGYCWQKPLTSKVVSRFSSPRTLPDGRSYYHTGLDLRARRPTPVAAAAAGMVVFAKHMIVPGNLVVIDHGLGLFSRYMHLSQFKVKEGDMILAGDSVGLSGSSGRVEGPHLHWEVTWKGNPGNPEWFVRVLEPFCDQESVATR